MDRLDIDALLIGSVYGELSAADEALLRAHLESHPADRTLLGRLNHARAAVQESGALAIQVEPPAQLSALLVQEAARRVPRKAAADDAPRGWFAWLRRSIFMHPAMAAAAMLLVVVSVAGTLYMRTGDHAASPQVAAPAAPELQSAEQRREASGYVEGAPAPTAGSGELDAVEKRAGDQAYRVDLAPDPGGVASQQPAAEPKRARPSNTILEVQTADRARTPKDINDADARALPATPAAPTAPIATAPPPPPAPPAPTQGKPDRPASKSARMTADPSPVDTTARRDVDAEAQNRSVPAKTEAPPSAGAGQSAGVVAKGATEPESLAIAQEADAAWSRDQHARLVTQVRAGNCRDAADTATELSGRAPSYYKQNVATDRAVKDCLAMINLNLERSKRAQTRRTLDNAKEPGRAKAAPERAAPAPAPRK